MNDIEKKEVELIPVTTKDVGKDDRVKKSASSIE